MSLLNSGLAGSPEVPYDIMTERKRRIAPQTQVCNDAEFAIRDGKQSNPWGRLLRENVLRGGIHGTSLPYNVFRFRSGQIKVFTILLPHRGGGG